MDWIHETRIERAKSRMLFHDIQRRAACAELTRLHQPPAARTGWRAWKRKGGCDGTPRKGHSQWTSIAPSGPKLEDGYIRIANELFDAILRFRFTLKTAKAWSWRSRAKTYGYGKKADDVSAAQIGELCGMSRNHVTETLNELAAMNVISKTLPGEYGLCDRDQ
jgi:phage replication O-like protein O